MNSDSDYDKYLKTKELRELKQIRGSLDKGKYPDRYKLVQEYIQKLSVITSDVHLENRSRGKHSFFEFSVLALSECLVLVQGCVAYFFLAFGRKEHTPQSLFEAVIPAIWLIFLLSSIYALFGKFRRTLQIALIAMSVYFALPFVSSELILFGILPTILLAFSVFWVNGRK